MVHVGTGRLRSKLSVGVIATFVAVVMLAAVAFAAAWPGGPNVTIVDNEDQFGGNLSGLAYEGSGSTNPGVLWAVRNGPGELYRLLWTGTVWVPDPNNGWGAGKALAFPGGIGDVDAEGVTFAADDPTSVYVGSERDNVDNGTSRNSVLRFDVTGSAVGIDASQEWNLTSDMPSSAPNGGIESIAWAPDSVLVADGLVDAATGLAYVPADYPDHGAGLFFVAHEASGAVFLYALDHADGTFDRIATFASGLPRVMGLEFDAEQGELWAACDSNCSGGLSLLSIGGGGTFTLVETYDRPTGLPDVNSEGFALAPLDECVGGIRPVFWADDDETDGHALRRGELTCSVPSLLCLGLVVTVDIGAAELPTEGDDVIMGTDLDDTIDGLGGDDVICGSGGNDTLFGGDGSDRLVGGPGEDVLEEGAPSMPA